MSKRIIFNDTELKVLQYIVEKLIKYPPQSWTEHCIFSLKALHDLEKKLSTDDLTTSKHQGFNQE